MIQGFIGNGSRSVLRRIEEGSEELKFRSHHCCESEESVDVARYEMSRAKKEDEDVGSW